MAVERHTRELLLLDPVVFTRRKLRSRLRPQGLIPPQPIPHMQIRSYAAAVNWAKYYNVITIM